MAKPFSIEVNVEGLEDYSEKVKIAAYKMRDFERKYLEALVNEVMKKVIPRTPVDTGRLRGSWKVTKTEVKGDTLEITIYNDARDNGADESYASYVELGHFTRNRVSFVDGVRMLTTSVDEVTAEMDRVWTLMFNQFVKEMGL